MVTLHCERGNEIDALHNKVAVEEIANPMSHALTRLNTTESEAVRQAIILSEKSGCSIYIVHVSAALSVRKISAFSIDIILMFTLLSGYLGLGFT